jgi:CRISPR-associated endonuclease/helicase Cas3
VLRGGTSADPSAPLAKSPDTPRSREQARAIRAAAGLPDDFRHEMLSVQLAEKHVSNGLSNEHRALLLHLIASHHGHARPFAPVCQDVNPPRIDGSHAATTLALSTEERTALPPHRLDSGIAERFWHLTRRFGWWGLGYHEAILRLADWHASAHPQPTGPQPEP